MTDQEYQILQSLSSLIPLLDDNQKEQLLSFGEYMVTATANQSESGTSEDFKRPGDKLGQLHKS